MVMVMVVQVVRVVRMGRLVKERGSEEVKR
jgi:hypothetical protein